jgi:hypothetical protein
MPPLVSFRRLLLRNVSETTVNTRLLTISALTLGVTPDRLLWAFTAPYARVRLVMIAVFQRQIARGLTYLDR